MKTCSKCKVEKELNKFSIREYKNDIPIYRNHCKACRTEHTLSKARENPEQTKRKKRESYHKNKDGILARKKTKYQINPEPAKLSVKKHYEANRDSKLDYAKTYRDKHKDQQRDYLSNYRVQNKDKINSFHRSKYKNDLTFSTMIKLRRTVRRIFNEEGTTKDDSTLNILGVSKDQLLIHLKNSNTSNTPVENCDIDHIVPLSAAHTLADKKFLSHYLNLQLLDSYTNRYIKRDIIPDNYAKIIRDIAIAKNDIDFGEKLILKINIDKVKKV